ncbi:MAG TPA: glycine--tRNA ligase subunit beta [Burkholderiales bacterium]|jgi:glycyl-tRNA synthetase beta chain|nr:glycine--tRNA ligase subunit beta [Burkholderiales bacterium]
MSSNLLVELVTEELPPKALSRLGDAFAGAVFDCLKSGGVLDATSRFRAFATPRRLAVYIWAVLAKAGDRPVEQKLMPVAVARKADGGWSDALRRKLASTGRERLADVPAHSKIGGESLAIKPDGKAESVFLRSIALGQPLERVLFDAIEEAIGKLPIPKVMSYQLADGATTVKFVRPAHALVALHGDKVLNVSALGLAAGRITHGHRFQGAKNIELARADEYESRLEHEGRVIADFEKRRDDVSRQLAENAVALKASLGPEEDVAPLLDEVTGLVELPTVYVGEFEPAFLGVPQECLILTMRQNQRYFPLFDTAGKLINKFLIVSNMRLADPKNIVVGNQRVIRPRLADARFFFETDKKTRLAERVSRLASIVYHYKLGSQLDRVERVRALAKAIAQMIGADPLLADRAALLAKADLVTSMVGEFPELQGIMGRYYALADGEDARVADAIEQHYRPRFAGDALPVGEIAIALALADKLEMLAGMFGIGQQPTGDKDPFALRRHALGVIRMLIESKLSVSLHDLISAAFSVFPGGMIGDSHTNLQEFIFERLRSYLREAGYTANEIEAVLCMRPVQLHQVPLQLAAVRAFSSLPEAESLAAANKRVINILKQAEAKGESFNGARAEALTETAERDLFDALAMATRNAIPLLQKGDYSGYLKAFAVLESPVDAFFDSVMVMVEDAAVRQNRLALLADLRREMNRIADISKLAA